MIHQAWWHGCVSPGRANIPPHRRHGHPELCGPGNAPPRHAGGPPRGRFDSSSGVVTQLGKSFDAIVDKAMQTDREKRYRTARELKLYLEKLGLAAGANGPRPCLRSTEGAPMEPSHAAAHRGRAAFCRGVPLAQGQACNCARQPGIPAIKLWDAPPPWMLLASVQSHCHAV